MSCVLVLTGCDRVLGLDRDSACVGGNGSGVVGPFQACFADEVTPELPPRATISTGMRGIDPGDCTEVITQTDVLHTEVCVVAAASITINSPISITGNRALVLAAVGDLSILVDLDLASRNPNVLGPGASYLGCTPSPGGNASSGSAGAGGGAGGSFGGIGGRGGNGTKPGGEPTPPQPLAIVRGGCAGGTGGHGAGPGGGGAGGAGGGALYLVAGGTVRIAGTINTSAAAGLGGGPAGGASDQAGGGGGGGSGGLIAIDARAVILESSARLVSNGGAGGGGGGNGSRMGLTTTAGRPGSEAKLTDSAPFKTVGGAGGEFGGGAGGAGGDLAAPATAGTEHVVTNVVDGAGGGGGGGTGMIVVYAKTFTDGGISSPAIQRP